MRFKILVRSLAGVASVLVVGCTIVEATPDDDASGGNGGNSGNGGNGGNAGAAAGGEGGSTEQQDDDPCEGVSTLGECKDSTTIRVCLGIENYTADDHVFVVETACAPGRICQEGTNGAECVVSGACAPGDIQCGADLRSVRVCEGTGDDTHWVSTPCNTSAGEQCHPGSPDSPAACMYVPSHSGGDTVPTFSGRVQYEYRPVSPDGKGWGDKAIQQVRDLYMTVYDDGEFIGAALSGYDSVAQAFTEDSYFVGILTREPTGNTQVWAWPMIFDYSTGLPLMALAKLTNTDPITNAREATEYWAWGMDMPPGTTDIGTWTITESQNSGALHIFQWIDYGLSRTEWGFYGKPQMSLAVYWNPATGTPTCGACFCGPSCGGAQVKYGNTADETDYFDSWIAIGGPANDGATQWSRSVISHEFGHYVMNNYSKSPGEGGTHYVNQASKPGLAYSEGWATAFGQTHIENARYVDQQSGTFFWVDISKYTYSGSSGSLAMPNPNGPIDQYINENVVAGMIWKLWVDPVASNDGDGRNLGDDKIFSTLGYGPLVNGTFNRGYSTVDLVDFFDAAICSSNASVADVNSVTQKTGYPYNPASRPCQ